MSRLQLSSPGAFRHHVPHRGGEPGWQVSSLPIEQEQWAIIDGRDLSVTPLECGAQTSSPSPRFTNTNLNTVASEPSNHRHGESSSRSLSRRSARSPSHPDAGHENQLKEVAVPVGSAKGPRHSFGGRAARALRLALPKAGKEARLARWSGNRPARPR